MSIAFSAEQTSPITKIALKYQGESSYRTYDISSVNWVLDPASSTATYAAISIATLTDTANSLPSGVITEIKFYGNFGGTLGWFKFAAPPESDTANGSNLLSSNLDLSAITRRKATLRFNGGVPGTAKARDALVQDL